MCKISLDRTQQINKNTFPMRNLTILLMLLLLCICSKMQGQYIQRYNYTYTYNAQGSCTSRVHVSSHSNDGDIKYPKLSEVEVSPVPNFDTQITLWVRGMPKGQYASYLMTNLGGQVVFKGRTGNGSLTLATGTLPRGLYILNVNGAGITKSYKLSKGMFNKPSN